MQKCIMIAFLLLLPVASHANGVRLSPKQATSLACARDAGNSVITSNEHMPLATQAVVLQETKAGTWGVGRSGVIVGDRGNSFGAKSYGLAQVKLETAKFMLHRYPVLGSFNSDEELLVALLVDDKFNVKIAANYLGYLWELFDGDFRRVLLAYNRGPSGSASGKDPNNYVENCLKHIKTTIASFNSGNYTVTSR